MSGLAIIFAPYIQPSRNGFIGIRKHAGKQMNPFFVAMRKIGRCQGAIESFSF
jgi:hypothetical protein